MNLDRFPLGRPRVELPPGRPKYPFILVADFVYLWPGYGKWAPLDIAVPAGYQTDLLSIPRPLWPILSPFGQGVWGAFPHDLLYGTRFSLPDQDEGDARAMADQILFDAAVDSGASRFRANLLFSGVRVGGKGAWSDGLAEEASDDLQAMVEATERWNQKKIISL